MESKENPVGNEPLLVVQLDPLNSSGKLKLNTTSLNRLLESVGNRPLSIFTILGPQKCGKSLVFGYMVKYLTAAEQENPEWFGWDNLTQPLDNFKWPNGENSPLNPGIWSFNRPFILKSDEGFGDPNQKEVAVLLLYGQLSSKRWITGAIEEMLSNLMGLAISTSSSIIFNLDKRIDENSLHSVAEGIKYAIQNSAGKLKETPFQNAIFLVRDWSFPTDFAFGMKGGTKFVNSEKLTAKPIHSRESRINRELIQAMFGSVSGCLLPFPGRKVVKPEFQGSISEMEGQFPKNLEYFISELINLDELPQKKNDQGGVMTADEWKSSIENYVTRCNEARIEQVNSSNILKKAGVSDLALPGEQMEILKIALKKYQDIWKGFRRRGERVLKDNELKENHKRARTSAMEAFRKCINPGIDEDDDDIANCGIEGRIEEFLKNELEKTYQEARRQNLAGWKYNWRTEKVKQYEQSMEQVYKVGIQLGSVTEKRMKEESEEIISGCMADFQKKFGANGEALEESEKFSFLEQLKISEKQFLDKLFKGKDEKI